MKSIIWKELRENAKWAGMGMLGLIVIMVLVLWDTILPSASQEILSMFSLDASN